MDDIGSMEQDFFSYEFSRIKFYCQLPAVLDAFFI